MDGSFPAIARLDEHRGMIDRVDVVQETTFIKATDVFRGTSNK
jgi:hypothetical protein